MPNAAENTANRPKATSGDRRHNRPICRDSRPSRHTCGSASHARGRWFEPSRAHERSCKWAGFACPSRVGTGLGGGSRLRCNSGCATAGHDVSCCMGLKLRYWVDAVASRPDSSECPARLSVQPQRKPGLPTSRGARRGNPTPAVPCSPREGGPSPVRLKATCHEQCRTGPSVENGQHADARCM